VGAVDRREDRSRRGADLDDRRLALGSLSGDDAAAAATLWSPKLTFALAAVATRAVAATTTTFMMRRILVCPASLS
jgi:hypothetical protein